MRAALSAVTIVVSLTLAVIIQEFAVRLAMPAYDPTNHVRFVRAAKDVPPLGPAGEVHRLVKNSGDYDVTVRFNRHGFRDSKDLANATAEDFFLVGDSFAFGWGVEEDERVSEQLQARIGRRVFNVAIPADFDGYAKLLDFAKRKGAPVRNVIVVVNMTDDLKDYDARKKQPRARATEGAGGRGRGVGLRQIKEFLLTHSSLYFLATSLVHRVRWLKELAVEVGLIVPLDQVPKRAITPQIIESSARRLARLAAHYRTVVVVVPIRSLWIGAGRENERQIHERFVTWLRALGIDVVDMRPVLESGGDPMKYHFANDGHWNPFGHALAAAALAAGIAHWESD